MSHLRLMKSIWIMDRIRESDEWHKQTRANPGGLYDRCVREMDRVSTQSTFSLYESAVDDGLSDCAWNAAVLQCVECLVHSFPWCYSCRTRRF